MGEKRQSKLGKILEALEFLAKLPLIAFVVTCIVSFSILAGMLIFRFSIWFYMKYLENPWNT